MKPKPKPGALRAVGRFLFALARALFVVLLVVIPIPIAALFPKGRSVYRKNQPAQVVKKSDQA